MAQATGIHIGRDRIAAVGLRGSPRSPKVLGMGVCPRPADPAALASTVRALLTERGIPRDPSVLALPNDAALMRTLALPFTNPEQIRRVLKGEAEAALAGISVEEMALGAHFLGAGEAEGRVLAVAMRKDTLGPLLAELAGVGVDPVAVDLEGLALANALVGLGHVPEIGAVVAVECTATEARFALLVDRRVKVVRSAALPLGVPDAPLEVPDDGAVEFEADVPAPVRAVGANPEALDELAAELTRTLVAGGLMVPPDRVLLLGPLAADPLIAAAVERVIGVTPEQADLLGDAGAPGPDAAECGVAYGAALKGLGFDHGEVNLRVDELAFKRRFDQVAGALATFVTLAFLVLLVLLIDLRQRASDLKSQWVTKALRPAFARYTEVLGKMEPDEAKRTAAITALSSEATTPRDQVMRRMISQLRKWKTQLQGGPVRSEFQMRSALDTWRDWADKLQAFQPRPKYWVLDQLEVDLKAAPSQGRVYCKGWVDVDKGREALEAMKNSLTTEPDFADTVPGVTTPGKGPDGEQRLSFSLTTTLPVEQPPKRGSEPKDG